MQPVEFLKLPDTILGRKVPTDWAWWMKYVGQVLTSPLLWAEKRDVVLLNVFSEIPNDEAGHFDGVLDFYFCGDVPSADDPVPPEKLLDWEKDALRILGDFRVYAGIDLTRARMHWWEFMSVFNSLPPDSQIKFAIQYRGWIWARSGTRRSVSSMYASSVRWRWRRSTSRPSMTKPWKG